VPLTPDHRFPAYSVTKLITATVVLRLTADGRIGLDDPARAHLRTVRPADQTVTVRDLLTHTAGVQNPGELFADHVPDLVTLVGPVVASAGPRGTFSYSNGGYGLLGQLVADVTGGTYPEAATHMVLGPLGMSGSWFPASWPAMGAVTGYHLAGDGSFETAPARICTVPAACGRPRLTWSASVSPGRHCCRPGWPARLSGPRWTGTPPGRGWAWAGCSTSRRTSAATPAAASVPRRR
jgi:CubicO group peptidase (beta-lactamase class C family)